MPRVNRRPIPSGANGVHGAAPARMIRKNIRKNDSREAAPARSRRRCWQEGSRSKLFANYSGGLEHLAPGDGAVGPVALAPVGRVD